MTLSLADTRLKHDVSCSMVQDTIRQFETLHHDIIVGNYVVAQRAQTDISAATQFIFNTLSELSQNKD